MQTALYSKIKERKGEWLIGASTQNLLLYLSIVAIRDKTKVRKAHKARRRDKIVDVSYSCQLEIKIFNSIQFNEDT